jgi:hypothetical protein
MSVDLLKELIQQVLEKQDLYSFLQLYSVQTWNKIGFVRKRKGLRLNETTITQNLVFDFWQLAMASKLPIEIYESKNEKAHGNDLEIIIETSKGFLMFPCQAKIIQRNNRYGTIHHKNKNSSLYQMDMLTNYAKQNKGIPVYLLYNFYSNHKRSCQIEEEIGFPLDYYGCSIVLAKYLKEHFPASVKRETRKAVIPSFEDLHPYIASPLQNFISGLLSCNVDTWLFENEHSMDVIKFYTEEELHSNEIWEDMAPLASIGFVLDEDKELAFIKSLNEKSTPFNPRFRIVLPIKRRQGVLIRYS